MQTDTATKRDLVRILTGVRTALEAEQVDPRTTSRVMSRLLFGTPCPFEEVVVGPVDQAVIMKNDFRAAV